MMAVGGSGLTYHSLLDPLLARVQRAPNDVAFWFWGEDDTRDCVTIGRFHAGMLAYARALHGLGLRPGDLTILVLNHSLDLLYAFWGALYIGAQPTIFPYFSPTQDADTYRELVHALVDQAEARAVVTSAEFAAPLSTLLADTGCRVLAVGSVDDDGGDSADTAPIAAYTGGDAVAFLQYTSGTTGLKKGVMLSHRAVLHCVTAMADFTNTTRADVIVNWLPLYHDYGLICGVFCPIVLDVPGVLISPYKWVRRPALLLEAIQLYGGTMCWMPNFAFNHTARVVREREMAGIDLSGVRALMSGAEPVRHDSQQAFVDRFAPHGFSADALCAGYGMAENTLAATITPVGTRNRVDWIDVRALRETNRAVSAEPDRPEAAPFVSCGKPYGGTQIRIVGDDGADLPERHVGTILIRSDSLFSGYYRRPDLTAAVMRDGWYDSGDAGYMAEGELFVCGRIKDIIIVSGKNIYPKDIEAIAMSEPDIKTGGAVAFGVENRQLGSEGIVLVAEMNRRLDDDGQRALAQRVRQRVTAEMGISLLDVRIVNKGWVVKTHNAKISRVRNRQKYLAQFRS